MKRFCYPNSKILYEGKRVDLISVEMKNRQGESYTREIVDHPGAVVILPLCENDHILLIQNEREIIQETLWELPAGTLEKNEPPLECAKRELIEETGYEAGKITFLIEFFSTPGFCNEKLFVFLAEDLHFVGQNLDDSEAIEPVLLPRQEVLQMIHKGVIHDAKTIASLLYFESYCRS